MIKFWEQNDFSRLIDERTRYKNFAKPTCTELILINKPRYFQDSNVFKTGLSDFYLLIVSEFKI